MLTWNPTYSKQNHGEHIGITNYQTFIFLVVHVIFTIYKLMVLLVLKDKDLLKTTYA